MKLFPFLFIFLLGQGKLHYLLRFINFLLGIAFFFSIEATPGELTSVFSRDSIEKGNVS